MSESRISDIKLVKSKDEYSSEENIEINVQFSLKVILETHLTRQIGRKHTTTMMLDSN